MSHCRDPRLPPLSPLPPLQWGCRFECQRSGNCCTGAPGRVWFSADERNAMARHLGLLPFQFVERYARRADHRWSLVEVESPRGYDCVFLETDASGRSSCRVYPVRPSQCRTWPFWPENLKSEAAYRALSKICPGVKAGLEGEQTNPV